MKSFRVFDEEIERWPGVRFNLIPGRKHRKIMLRYRDERRLFVCASSGSDSRRGWVNARGDLRRLLRSMGATRKE